MAGSTHHVFIQLNVLEIIVELQLSPLAVAHNRAAAFGKSVHATTGAATTLTTAAGSGGQPTKSEGSDRAIATSRSRTSPTPVARIFFLIGIATVDIFRGLGTKMSFLFMSILMSTLASAGMIAAVVFSDVSWS